jgi:hypothetical protein
VEVRLLYEVLLVGAIFLSRKLGEGEICWRGRKEIYRWRSRGAMPRGIEERIFGFFFWLGRWYRGSASVNHSLVPKYQGHVKISHEAIVSSQHDRS